uniref:SH3 domain-containing protein n=1 Tax=Oryctolagus cuniculus TaxID=9986 RepID=A0A5F9CLJ9_RABIT
MEAVAKFDFTASGEDELSFHTGDVLKVGDAGPPRGSGEFQPPESGHHRGSLAVQALASEELRF